MDSFLQDWLELVLRWVHVLAAIAWIGHAFLFHSLEKALRPPVVADVDPDVRGELWMVHGGGFFRMQKTRVLPPVITGELHWFKYEALLTWVSGFLLLLSLYWMAGGVLMVDARVAPLSPGAAVGIGAGALILGWLGYDLIWATPLAARIPLATALTVGWIAALAVGMTQLLSGRAAFLHTGAMLGTLMTANVWMRIIPGSKRTVAALTSGREPDPRDGAVGHQRSVHNGYLHFPIVFLMISAHYPRTYAHEANWLVLLLLLVVGAAFRQVFYDGRRTHPAIGALLAGSVLALGWLTAPRSAPAEAVPPSTDRGPTRPIPAATVGQVAGVVRVVGEVPPPRPLTLLGGCELERTGPVTEESLLVADGRVRNVVVHVRGGWEGWSIPPAPTAEVVVDQRGCVYVPRVHGARVGQPVTFVNSDPLFHNVRSVSEANDVFNLTMPARDQRITRHFRRPEVAVQARCDVHPWMASWIAVFPHDWWAITDAEGRFEIVGLPPGTYDLEAWHEVLGTRAVTIEVAERALLTADFTFELPAPGAPGAGSSPGGSP